MVRQLSCYNRSHPPRGPSVRIPPQEPKESEGIEGKAGVIRPDWESDSRNGAPCRLGGDPRAGSTLTSVPSLTSLQASAPPLESKMCAALTQRPESCTWVPEPRGVHPCPPRNSRYRNPSSDGENALKMAAPAWHKDKEIGHDPRIHSLPASGKCTQPLTPAPPIPSRTISLGPRKPHLSFSWGPE